MCGIIGIVAKNHVNQELFDGLTLLQHRGQDAAGIVTCDENQVYMRKSNGLVRDVIHTRHMLRLKGKMGIGHVRYPTAGTASAAEAQPFYVNSPYGISLAHNGNLVNTDQLKQELWRDDLRHLNTQSDSEVILNVFAHELQQLHQHSLSPQDVFKAVSRVHARCLGAYAVVALITGYGMVAFRDPFGIRPLMLGMRETENGAEYMVASESIAIESLNFKILGDLKPGEAVYITKDGSLHRQVCAAKTQLSPCLFEFVYLARPDSVIDKSLVYKVRLKLGDYLAEKIRRSWPTDDIDVVMPVPDTSRIAAYSLALKLNLKYREGLVKNHYVGRTFIMPGQKIRKKSIRQKLNAIDLEFRGKNVLLVDDSIVRGTTSREIIQMARDAGAKKVYFASAAPQVRYPNVYGIDIPSVKELVAHDRTDEEICQWIGADKLIFQDLDALVSAVREGNPVIPVFEDCVFSGKYLTGGVDSAYLERLDRIRSEAGSHDSNLEDIAVGIENDD